MVSYPPVVGCILLIYITPVGNFDVPVSYGIYICHDEATLQRSDSAINVLHAPWFITCTVWFVASLSCINMTSKL